MEKRLINTSWKELPTGEISSDWVADLRNAPSDRCIPKEVVAFRLLEFATGADEVPHIIKWVSNRTYALLNPV